MVLNAGLRLAALQLQASRVGRAHLLLLLESALELVHQLAQLGRHCNLFVAVILVLFCDIGRKTEQNVSSGSAVRRCQMHLCLHSNCERALTVWQRLDQLLALRIDVLELLAAAL